MAELLAKQIAKVNEAITAKFGHYLKVGEGITAEVEEGPDFTLMRITLAASDESFRLELAAAIEYGAEHKVPLVEKDAWSIALDFLDVQLEDYFGEERFMRFHEEWLVYDYLGTLIKFQGTTRRPDLEALADQWLAQAEDEQVPEDDYTYESDESDEDGDEEE